MSDPPVQSPILLDLRRSQLKDDITPLEFVGHWENVGGFAEIINTGVSAMVNSLT